MSDETSPEIAAIVAQYFETRRAGHRIDIDELVPAADAIRRSQIKASVLDRITRRIRSGQSCVSRLAAPEEMVAEPNSLPDLDGYDLIEEIGRGGMGVVYEAYQRSTGRRVAVKFISATAAATVAGRRRFEREVELAARLAHPAIISVLDSGLHQGRYFAVLEYIDGFPLDQALPPGEADVRTTLLLLAEICDAIDYAHQRGVLHRDLKPSNILVTVATVDGNSPATGSAPSFGIPDGVNRRLWPKILDFGLARPIEPGDDSARLTLAGPDHLLGTLAYMAPEQASGQIDLMSVRSDVYSLGAIAYELLTGRIPCDINRPLPNALRQIAEIDPAKPSSFRPGLPADVDAMVLKALQKRPAERYATAGEFSADLRRFLRDEPIFARPVSAWEQLRKFTRRNRALVGGVAAAVMLLLTGVIATSWQALRATRAEKSALRERDAARLARDEARREADKAIAVTEFIQNMLSAADPASGDRKLLTVREVFDQAALRLEADFPDNPDTRNAVRSTLIATYRALGLHEPAERHAREALAWCEANRGAEDADTLRAKHALALILLDQGRLPDADALIRATLDSLQRTGGPDDPALLRVKRALATLLNEQGRLDESESLSRDLIERLRRLRGPQHPEYLGTQRILARTLQLKGDLAGAETVMQEILNAQRASLGRVTPDVSATLALLGELATMQDRLGDAELYFREAAEILTDIYGDEHPSTLMRRSGLAYVMFLAGKHEEGIRMSEDVLAIRRRVSGSVNASTLTTMINLARLYELDQRLAEAEILYREVLDVQRKIYGADTVRAVPTLSVLANVRFQQGDAEATDDFHQERLAVAAKNPGAVGSLRLPEQFDALREARAICENMSAPREIRLAQLRALYAKWRQELESSNTPAQPEQ